MKIRIATLVCLWVSSAVAWPLDTDSLESLSVQQAREAGSGKGTLSFRNVSEVSLEVAQVLAQYRAEVRLNGLKQITPEVARALSQQPKAANLCLNGLTEITPEVAEALAVRNGGMLSLNALTEITPEVARELAKVRAKLTLNGLQSLPVEVARELAKHPSKLTLFSVPQLSDEAAEAIAEHRSTLLLHGLIHLSSPKLVGKMLKSNDGFVSFKNAETMTEDVARVFAAYDGKKAMSLESLTGLPEASASLLRESEKLVLPAHLRKPGFTNSLGMRLAFIPAGKFAMGSPKSEPKREVQERRHEVELSKEFYLGVHEVTVGQFRRFVSDTEYQTDAESDGKGSWGITSTGSFEQDAKYNWTSPGFKQTDNHPVVDVSWNDAKAFCQWLSKKEKRTYRLPTEAEWEYACRAGTLSAYAFGDDAQHLATWGNAADATARAAFNAWSLGIKGEDGYAYTAPVGQFKPNRFGLFDMHGNVWEWCEDWFDENAYGATKRIDPTGPDSGSRRVHRGGGWSSAPERCRSASRIGRDPSSYRGCYLGFRVVLEGEPLAEAPRSEKQSSEERSAGAQGSNPYLVQALDPKLEKKFDYLVYDLGKGVELKLVRVPAKGRTFAVGASAKEQDEVTTKYFDGKRPASLEFEVEEKMTLTDDFYIGRFEVTRGQFRRFVEDGGYTTETEATDGGYGWNEELKKFEGRDRKYSWKNYGVSSETDEHPVTNITRNDARKYCEWLAKKGDGKIRLREVRLPGEAEWEFACRAGSSNRFSFGDDDERLTEFANVADGTWAETFAKSSAIHTKDGHAFSSPVGQFQPNAFGLYDMHGNVWEWVEDYYGKYSALPKSRNGIQTENQGQRRPVMRGGAWYTGPEACRSARRWLVGIGGRYGSGGFRVVCVP